MKTLQDLFTNLSVVGYKSLTYEELGSKGYILFVESASNPDTIGISVEIPAEVVRDYDFGPHGPKPT